MRVLRLSLATAGCLVLSACATMSSEESALRGLMWDAATECARGTATITVTDVDSHGRVWYSLAAGGKQDIPQFDACYSRRAGEELAKRPDLAEYLRHQPRR